jgi:putative ABC transport system ATP-binding protein
MADSKEAVLRLEGVRKVFFTDDVETHALADVHFSVRRGEFVAINGPSGSGKTTLLSILGLLEEPNEGTYFLGDRAVGDLDGAERAKVRNRQIGFIFQTFNLIGDLTVYENVELPLVYRGLAAKERKQRVEAALERVSMGHRARHMPSQLSGGQQQRVAVARAVVGDPLIVLADEPTGNLDSVNGEAVMNAAGATVCMVTHNPLYAAYASRVVQLLDGRVVDETDHPAAASSGAAPRPAALPATGTAAPIA